MEKKTFLGIDRTPRKALWAEIKRLNKQIEIQERHSVDQQANIDLLKDAFARSEASRISAETSVRNFKLKICRKDQEIDKLRARLDRYNCPKDKSGKFTKRK